MPNVALRFSSNPRPDKDLIFLKNGVLVDAVQTACEDIAK